MKSIHRILMFIAAGVMVLSLASSSIAFDFPKIPLNIPLNKPPVDIPAPVPLNPIECGGVPKVFINPDSEFPLLVQEVFDNMDSPRTFPKLANQGINTFLSSFDNKYHICFNIKIDDDEKVIFEEISSSINLITDNDKDIIVDGLRLKRADGLADGKPVLRIQNNGKGKLTISDLSITNSRDGVLIDAPSSLSRMQGGIVHMKKSEVTGDEAKSGNCYHVKANGTILGKIEASSCAEGVRVEADNISITNKSIIKSNDIGIHCLAGTEGFKIEKSLVFNNNDGDDSNEARFDGIRLDPPIFRDLSFYEVVDAGEGGEKAIEKELNEDGVLEYNSRVYVVLPEILVGTGQVDFYFTSPVDCVEAEFLGQICAFSNMEMIELSIEDTKLGTMKEFPLSAGKTFTAIYTSDDLGSTTLARPVRVSEEILSGVVAIVNTPYDIPTSPAVDNTGTGDTTTPGVGTYEYQGDDFQIDPANLPEPEDEGSGGNRMDGEVVGVVAGGGPLPGARAAAGCGGSLIAANNIHTITCAGSFWWIVFSLGLMASLRFSLVRIRKKY